MGRVGLALGAGGSVGHAFHVGVLSALAERTGWDPRDADLIVGTSTGSLVGAHLRAGARIEDLVARALGQPLSEAGRALFAGAGGRPAQLPLAQPAPIPRLAGLSMLTAAARRPWAARVGTLAAAAIPIGRFSTEPLVIHLRQLYDTDWPDRELELCAVRLDTGARVVFGTPGAPKADIATAVAASLAIPGYFAPVRIDDVLFVDGGVHSPTNLDLLARRDLDLVVVSSPMSMTRSAGARRLDAAVRLHARRYLARETAAVRRSGTPVLVIQPSSDDLAIMGVNAMDGGRAPSVVRQVRESALRHLAKPEVEERLALLR